MLISAQTRNPHHVNSPRMLLRYAGLIAIVKEIDVHIDSLKVVHEGTKSVSALALDKAVEQKSAEDNQSLSWVSVWNPFLQMSTEQMIESIVSR